MDSQTDNNDSGVRVNPASRLSRLSQVEHKRWGLREVVVEDYSDSEFPDSDSSEEDEKVHVKPKADIPPEFWHIQKLIKYIKTGNQTATLISLSCLKDHHLNVEINQTAIQEIGGLEILVNLLQTDDLKCKLGTLEVLTQLTTNPEIRRAVTDLGGVKLLVQNLAEPLRDLQILVAENIYNVCHTQKARAHVRKFNGIGRLVDFLDISQRCITLPSKDLTTSEKLCVKRAESAVRALWSVSLSEKNVIILMKKGSVPLLGSLLKSVHGQVLIPVCGTLSQCSKNKNYQIAIQTEGIIKDIVKYLTVEDCPELRRYCAEIIFKCGELPKIRENVRHCGGLDPLVFMAKDPNLKSNKPLLAAVTGAIWKTAISPENVERFDQLKTVEVLVKLLDSVEEDEDVLTNVVGALTQFLQYEDNRHLFTRLGGMPPLINLLNYSYCPLLVNVPLSVKECAVDEECMRLIEDLDGIRYIWSLLKNDSPQVQASAALSLVPCIRYANDSGEMVRCLVGGLELIVELLKSEHVEVLASICAAISEIAKDIENLAIITDHGVIPMLVDLIQSRNNLLRQHLAAAIASCCAWGSNCKMFGRLGAITPLVQYMADDDKDVHRTTAQALFQLSHNPFNCITMHESGIVAFLLQAISSNHDHELQDAAAGCLANIRKLALTAETTNLVRKSDNKYTFNESESEKDDTERDKNDAK